MNLEGDKQKLKNSFTNAANSLTNLFKNSVQLQEQAYKQGEKDAISEIVQFCIQTTNGDIRNITKEALLEFLDNKIREYDVNGSQNSSFQFPILMNPNQAPKKEINFTVNGFDNNNDTRNFNSDSMTINTIPMMFNNQSYHMNTIEPFQNNSIQNQNINVEYNSLLLQRDDQEIEENFQIEQPNSNMPYMKRH